GQALPALLANAPHLFALLDAAAVAGWVEAGLAAYSGGRHRLPAYFGLETADAAATLARFRRGTLLADRERELMLIQKVLWRSDSPLRPVVVEIGQAPKPAWLDGEGIHLPDALHDLGGVSGAERYRARLAHLAAHRRWSAPFLADNFSVFQHLAIEVFEDSRVEALAMAEYPGLGPMWRALHPIPRPDACPSDASPIRHRLAMLSRALLDPGHSYADPSLLDFVARFRRRMAADPHDQSASAELGVRWLKESYDHSYRRPGIWFEDTLVDYRDDNRVLWRFLEDVKNEDEFHSDYGALDRFVRPAGEDAAAPPRRYHEWDHGQRGYRLDWTSVYEVPAPAGDSERVDAMLAAQAPLARRLRKVLDRLTPQGAVRSRGHMDGDDIDLDRLIRARLDLRQGREPDPRVFVRNRPGERDVAVLLLLDLSRSVSATPAGAQASILSMERESAALLAWAAAKLGDPLAVAGFASDTRHRVLFRPVKGFEEAWTAAPKARLAGLEAGLSTRMGAAMRHAGTLLERRRERRRLLLVLSDGEPADVDEPDPSHLKWDAHAAATELRAKGIVPFCIALDPAADAYAGDIFGANGHAVVDRPARLPERLTTLFLTLTR
ncbi:MAG: hypothetical protein HQL41_18300, partial [Alphaproteobacteria bacterium]|nr:hypothetical protein [Alphaproteobacteria bacterium]